jgi:pyrimidine operon attenuation protein/uracil phosphoribosyltransferase
MKKQQLILNKQAINNKIKRIGLSIVEKHHTQQTLTIIGFKKNGYIIAEKLKKNIEESYNIKIQIHEIKVDKNKTYKITPKLSNKNLKNVFLADDVLKSGKTIMYGIKAILEYPVENLKTIILVNRHHNQFPIGVDYIGLNLSTTLKDHIKVVFNEEEEAVYLI